MHRLDEHWALSHRYQRPVAIITLDIDNFKQINDVYGHSAGDIVLQGVSEAFRECIRTTDIVGRIGGEEFLIILPCQTAQEAEICAQRCRHAVATREFVFGDHKIQTTISAGIASRRTDMSEAADLLHEADAALYAAKRAGRNAVCSSRSDALLEITGLLV
jgi:two-component system, cell cycle response regulator